MRETDPNPIGDRVVDACLRLAAEDQRRERAREQRRRLEEHRRELEDACEAVVRMSERSCPEAVAPVWIALASRVVNWVRHHSKLTVLDEIARTTDGVTRIVAELLREIGRNRSTDDVQEALLVALRGRWDAEDGNEFRYAFRDIGARIWRSYFAEETRAASRTDSESTPDPRSQTHPREVRIRIGDEHAESIEVRLGNDAPWSPLSLSRKRVSLLWEAATSVGVIDCRRVKEPPVRHVANQEARPRGEDRAHGRVRYRSTAIDESKSRRVRRLIEVLQRRLRLSAKPFTADGHGRYRTAFADVTVALDEVEPRPDSPGD